MRIWIPILALAIAACSTPKNEPSPAATPATQASSQPVAAAVGDPAGNPAKLGQQGEDCVNQACEAHLECLTYFGIAGPYGPKFGSCEIRCGEKDTCPDGQMCTTIMDGPGKVCRTPPASLTPSD